MSPLAVRIGLGVLVVLALIALRGKRWAYFGVVVLGLAYFPAQAHFQLHMPKYDLLLPTTKQLLPLLQNYTYIALFAGFYWMSWVQFKWTGARPLWAFLATLLAGVLFEIAEGASLGGRVAHCRVRDLVPYAAGALGAMVLLTIWARLTRKPGYVRLVKKRTAAAPPPPPAAPPPRASLPRRAVIYDPPAYSPPPPPPDFSPGPPTSAEPVPDAEPTEEVAHAPTGGGRGARAGIAVARTEIVRRLQTVLGYVRSALQRIWRIIVGRRRAIVMGVVLLGVVGAGAFVFLRLSAPAPVVTAQAPPPPPEPPPPPPRPLQSEIEGYYEPTYKFTVFDRRFTRLTLRPNTSVMFSRPGVRQVVPCEEARITQDVVRLKCTLEPYGLVTVEGRFPSRYATSKLDMPVLSALITVTNNRGEVQYRARDQFYWHVPDPD